jgi:hypothetical protein
MHSEFQISIFANASILENSLYFQKIVIVIIITIACVLKMSIRTYL